MAVTTRTPLSCKKSAPLFVPRGVADDVFHIQHDVFHIQQEVPMLVEHWTPSSPHCWWPDAVLVEPTLESETNEDSASWAVQGGCWSAPLDNAPVRGASDSWPRVASVEDEVPTGGAPKDLTPAGGMEVPSFPWRRVEAWPAGEFPGAVSFGKPLHGTSDDGTPPSKDLPWHNFETKSTTSSSAGSDADASTEDGTPVTGGSFTSRSSESGEAALLEEPQDSPTAETEDAAGALHSRLRLNANADLFMPRVVSSGEMNFRPKAGSWSPSSTNSGGCEQPERDRAGPLGSEPCGLESLKVSENSWAAQRRAAKCSKKKDDSEIAGMVRAILNKMTLEKFPRLSQQLLHCEINTTNRMKRLITELFEVAVSQHHFIDMYADLCLVLHEHFQRFPIGDGPKTSFKWLLLAECQESFTRGSKDPKIPDGEWTEEDKGIWEAKYRTCALGNIKLIGALCVRGMLASKVFMAILAELTSQKTEESIEGFTALLTVVGPVFDTPKFHAYDALNGFFGQAAAILAKPDCGARSRCLLQNLLDLRQQAWQHTRPARMEAPMTLMEVERKMSLEDPSWSQGCYYSLMPSSSWDVFF